MNSSLYVDPKQVASLISNVLLKGKPFSMIRLGVMERKLIDRKIQRGLVTPANIMEGVKRANLVGIDWNAFRGHPLVRAMSRFQRSWTHRDINWRLYNAKRGPLVKWVSSYSLLLIGRRAGELAQWGKARGLQIAGFYELDNPLKLAQAQAAAKKTGGYNLVLISSDIGSAPVLAPRLALTVKCVVLDIGLVLDDLIENL